MASAQVYKMDGTAGASVRLNETIFEQEPNVGLVHQVATVLQNNQRQGNAKTKERSDVSGGGAKPFRQKGTGNARQGSSREPQMRGGGTVFGPRPRSYRKDVPVKMRRKALCCVLSDRLRSENLCVLESLPADSAKTKPIVATVEKLAPERRKTLIIVPQHDEIVLKSARNVPALTVRTAHDVNALDVLHARKVIVLQEALDVLEARLS